MTDHVRRRLLVIDDYEDLLRLIAKCLQQAGYEVITARSAEGALMNMAEVLPDLIVTDVMMPGMDGYDLVEQIRKDPRTDLIPIIFLTARDTRSDRIKGLHAGIDAYLTKPFEPEELVALIENIFKRVRRTHRRVARLPRSATQPADTSVLPNNTSSVASGAETGDARNIRPRDATLPSLPTDLTESEHRVAGLVAQGLSNKEIALSLGISYRTVEMHISNILAKKNLTNRVELALMIARELSTEDETT